MRTDHGSQDYELKDNSEYTASISPFEMIELAILIRKNLKTLKSINHKAYTGLQPHVLFKTLFNLSAMLAYELSDTTRFNIAQQQALYVIENSLRYLLKDIAQLSPNPPKPLPDAAKALEITNDCLGHIEALTHSTLHFPKADKPNFTISNYASKYYLRRRTDEVAELVSDVKNKIKTTAAIVKFEWEFYRVLKAAIEETKRSNAGDNKEVMLARLKAIKAHQGTGFKKVYADQVSDLSYFIQEYKSLLPNTAARFMQLMDEQCPPMLYVHYRSENEVSEENSEVNSKINGALYNLYQIEIQKKETNLAAQNTAFKAICDVLSPDEKKITTLEKENQDAHASLKSANKKYASSTEDKKDKKQKSKKQKLKMAETKEQQTEELESKKSVLSALIARQDELEQNPKKYQKEIKSNKQEIEKLQKVITKLSTKVNDPRSTLRKQIEWREEQIDKIKKDMASQVEEREKLVKQIELLRGEIKELERKRPSKIEVMKDKVESEFARRFHRFIGDDGNQDVITMSRHIPHENEVYFQIFALLKAMHSSMGDEKRKNIEDNVNLLDPLISDFLSHNIEDKTKASFMKQFVETYIMIIDRQGYNRYADLQDCDHQIARLLRQSDFARQSGPVHLLLKARSYQGDKHPRTCAALLEAAKQLNKTLASSTGKVIINDNDIKKMVDASLPARNTNSKTSLFHLGKHDFLLKRKLEREIRRAIRIEHSMQRVEYLPQKQKKQAKHLPAPSRL